MGNPFSIMVATVVVGLILVFMVIAGVILMNLGTAAAERIARDRRLRRLPPDIYADQAEIEAFMDQSGASMDKSSIAPK